MPRTLLGFLFSVLALPVAVAFAGGGAALLAGVTFVITLAVSVCFGMPIYLWLKQKKLLKASHFLISGVLLGVLLSTPILIFPDRTVFADIMWLFGAVIVWLLSAGHALIFWLIAIYRNSTLAEEIKALTVAQTLPAAKTETAFTPQKLMKLAGLAVIVVAVDALLPATEKSELVHSGTFQGLTINYWIPYSAGDTDSCLIFPGSNHDYKEGTKLLLKKSRILGLCSVSPLPDNWVEPEYGSMRSMEK